jgi:hypothetical protein
VDNSAGADVSSRSGSCWNLSFGLKVTSALAVSARNLGLIAVTLFSRLSAIKKKCQMLRFRASPSGLKFSDITVLADRMYSYASNEKSPEAVVIKNDGRVRGDDTWGATSDQTASDASYVVNRLVKVHWHKGHHCLPILLGIARCCTPGQPAEQGSGMSI